MKAFKYSLIIIKLNIFCIFFNICAQNKPTDLVDNFYKNSIKSEYLPRGEDDYILVENQYIFRALRYNKVLINRVQIEDLIQKSIDSFDSLNLNAGIFIGDSVIYKNINIKKLVLATSDSKCNNYNFFYNADSYFYEITDFAEKEMKNALGIILFQSKEDMQDAKEKITIIDHDLWELDKEISGEEYEEITHREVALINIGCCSILLQVNGARYQTDREYLYSNIISYKKCDTICKIAYLTSYDCIEGYYIGY